MANHENNFPQAPEFEDTEKRMAESRRFVDYLDPEPSLEDRVEAAYDDLKISPERRESIKNFLRELRDNDQSTYEHSLRVGLAARAIARHEKLDEKALLYAGLLHDIGKKFTNKSTLTKTEGWNEHDTKEIRRHVEDGRQLLRGTFDFTAEIIDSHHQFQPHTYPETPPPLIHSHGEETKKLLALYRRLTALADSYDALHRINDKTGKKTALTGEEIKVRLLAANPDISGLIQKLYEDGVFTTYVVNEDQG